MRHATAEQKARADEKRKQFLQLAKQIADMSDGQRAELAGFNGAATVYLKPFVAEPTKQAEPAPIEPLESLEEWDTETAARRLAA